jgi:hypothetical protein
MHRPGTVQVEDEMATLSSTDVDLMDAYEVLRDYLKESKAPLPTAKRRKQADGKLQPPQQSGILAMVCHPLACSAFLFRT